MKFISWTSLNRSFFKKLPIPIDFNWNLGHICGVISHLLARECSWHFHRYFATRNSSHKCSCVCEMYVVRSCFNPHAESWWDITNICPKKECIPVGCVPTALYRTGGSLSRRLGSLSRGCLSGRVSVRETLWKEHGTRERDPLEGTWDQRKRPPWKEHGTRQPDRKWHHTETPLNRMTDRQV